MNNILEKKKGKSNSYKLLILIKFCFMMLYLLKMRMQYFMLVEMVFKFYFDFGIFNLSSSKGLFDNGYYVNTLIIS